MILNFMAILTLMLLAFNCCIKGTNCIAGISDWMKSNRLQLNSTKTDFLWCSSSRRRKQLDQTPFTIGISAVQPARLPLSVTSVFTLKMIFQ
jgi:hypothetical protein